MVHNLLFLIIIIYGVQEQELIHFTHSKVEILIDLLIKIILAQYKLSLKMNGLLLVVMLILNIVY